MVTADPTPLSQGAHCPLLSCHRSLTTHICPEPPPMYQPPFLHHLPGCWNNLHITHRPSTGWR